MSDIALATDPGSSGLDARAVLRWRCGVVDTKHQPQNATCGIVQVRCITVAEQQVMKWCPAPTSTGQYSQAMPVEIP